MHTFIVFKLCVDITRCIVDRGEYALLASILKPMVIAAVELHHLTAHRFALTPLSVGFGVFSSARFMESVPNHDGANGLDTEHHLLLFLKLLLCERRPEIGVFLFFQERDDKMFVELLDLTIGWRATTTVHDSLFTVKLHCSFESAYLSHGDIEASGSFLVGDLCVEA